jgi:hypothetical protein
MTPPLTVRITASVRAQAFPRMQIAPNFLQTARDSRANGPREVAIQIRAREHGRQRARRVCERCQPLMPLAP